MPRFFNLLSLRGKLILINVLVAVPVVLITLFFVFPLLEGQIRLGKEELTRSSVEVAIDVIRTQYEKQKSGELTESEAKTRAMALVRPLRYAGHEYFWIHDLDLKMVMHPVKPALENQSLREMKDSSGKFFFSEMNALCEKQGGGFVNYLWPKPGVDKPVPKISYVGLFKEWGWIIGNGVYLDEVEAAVFAIKRKVLLALGSVFLLSFFVSFIVSSQVANSVGQVVRGLESTGQHVLANSHKLSSAGTSLSTNVMKSAASLEETVASISQVTSMVSRNSQNAKHAASLSEAGREVASKGAKEISELISSMKAISVSAKKIEAIITIIDDIAFQTNLLALNAAVEAARAGEQGRGFAVVAEAVRSLATRSSAAAKDITQLIRSASAQVDEGSKAVDNSSLSLQEILEVSQKVAAIVVEIAGEGEEQARNLDQVSVALSQIDNVTQGNASSAESVATWSREMAAHADHLKARVRDLEGVVFGGNTEGRGREPQAA